VMKEVGDKNLGLIVDATSVTVICGRLGDPGVIPYWRKQYKRRAATAPLAAKIPLHVFPRFED
jgi:hypothetical protein